MIVKISTVASFMLLCLLLSVECFAGAGQDEKSDKLAVVKEDTALYLFAGSDRKMADIKKGAQLKVTDDRWYDGETWYKVESAQTRTFGYIQERYLKPIGWSFKGDPFFQVNPQAEFGIMVLGISLPEQFNFASGSELFKYCPWCEEPNRPIGPVFYLGGALNMRIASKIVLGSGVLLNGISTDFRDGFTDRRRWPAPREGEAYTYTRVSDLEHTVPYINIGYMGTFGRKSRSEYLGSYEFGVRWLRFKGLTLEQGFDRYNSRDPIRTMENIYVTSRGYYFDVRHHEGKLGFFGTFFVIPTAVADFDKFGQAHIRGGGLSLGLSVRP